MEIPVDDLNKENGMTTLQVVNTYSYLKNSMTCFSKKKKTKLMRLAQTLI